MCGFFCFQRSYFDQAAARKLQPLAQYARSLLLGRSYLKPRVERAFSREGTNREQRVGERQEVRD